MIHEIWHEEDVRTTFCLAGPLGDPHRADLGKDAKLIGTIEARSYFEAMTKYWAFMDWGEYKLPPVCEFLKDPYPPEKVATQNGLENGG